MARENRPCFSMLWKKVFQGVENFPAARDQCNSRCIEAGLLFANHLRGIHVASWGFLADLGGICRENKPRAFR